MRNQYLQEPLSAIDGRRIKLSAKDEIRGIPIKILEASDPDIKRKKLVLWNIPAGCMIIIILMTYFALFRFQDDKLIQSVIIVAMLTIISVECFMFIFLHSVFGRTWRKVNFYDNGIEIPQFFYDKLMGRKKFVPRDQILSVEAACFVPVRPQTKVVSEDTAELRFKTTDGKVYRTGQRIKKDIQSLSRWLEEDWKLKVQGVDWKGRPMAPPHKVLVVGEHSRMICTGCGHSFTDETNFCPSCGKMVIPGTDPLETSSSIPSTKIERPQYQQNRDTYSLQDHPGLQTPNTGHEEYHAQQLRDTYAKDLRLATKLAVILGLLGIMGIGHIYMRKIAKGIVLFLVGGFFALLSLVSIYLIFQPDEFSLQVKIATAVIMSAPFLIVLIWQIFDAPKPVRSSTVEDPYRWKGP
jgi:TM2 domain-containing membrane protein YozV